MLKKLLALVTSLSLVASVGLSALALDELPEAGAEQPEVVAGDVAEDEETEDSNGIAPLADNNKVVELGEPLETVYPEGYFTITIPRIKIPPAKPGVFHMRAKPYVASHVSRHVGTI